MSLFGSSSSSLSQDASGRTWSYPALRHEFGDSEEGGGHPLLLHLLERFGDGAGIRTRAAVVPDG